LALTFVRALVEERWAPELTWGPVSFAAMS
jgi:hypothetical protein